jgi:DUF4097 and DUF4098 domain-containing protein YvlB
VVIVVVVGGSLWGTVGGRSETQRSTVDAPGRIRVDSQSGDVDITRSDGNQVSIERRLEWSTSRPEITERRDGDTLVLASRCGGFSILFFNRCTVSYTIRVPASVEVDVETGSGDVGVRDTTGAVTVDTGSGNVSVRGATGRLDVRTGSGDVSASGLGGDAVLRTGSGSVTATWAAVPRSVDARTGSGDVTLTVPPGQYDVRGADGDADISVDSTAGAPNTIEVDTGSGDIRVKHP